MCILDFSFNTVDCAELLFTEARLSFYHLNLCPHRNQTATGARQCLSTGHRKQQDFRLWILPLWILVVQIKSSASTSGPCASCRIVSRDESRRILRLLNWQLIRSATLYIRVLRTILALRQDIYCAFWPSSRHRRSVSEISVWNLHKFRTNLNHSSVFLCTFDFKLHAFQSLLWCSSFRRPSLWLFYKMWPDFWI